MKLAIAGHPHLTWNAAVHGGETWPEVRHALVEQVLPVRAEVDPDVALGVGLRLGACAAEQLAAPDALEELKAFLVDNGLYVFTLQGTTFGSVLGRGNKAQASLPDWLDEARLLYTERLASLLATLLPPGMPSLCGSITTVPGALRARIRTTTDLENVTDRLVRLAASLHRLWEETGRIVVLGLEPEPCGLLDTAAETVGVFENQLFARPAIRRLLQVSGCNRADAEPILRRHLGVCLDACHAATGFEEPRKVAGALLHAGIGVAKIQLGVCAELAVAGTEAGAREALLALADDHRTVPVVEQRAGKLIRHADVAEAVDRLSRSDPVVRTYRARRHLSLASEDAVARVRPSTPQLHGLTTWLRTVAASQHLELEVDAAHLGPDGVAGELRAAAALLLG